MNGDVRQVGLTAVGPAPPASDSRPSPAVATGGPGPQLAHLAALVIIAVYAMPLLLVHLGTGDATAMMELFNVISVREAYRDHHWLVPTLNGMPRLEKPPLPVWLPAALATVIGNDSLWVLRLPSALLGLLTCGVAYGIGCLGSGDRRVGLFAALALASTWFFVSEARLASYDIYATAFIWAGLFGLLGMVRRPERRVLWIPLTGVSVGLAILSKGPIPAATVYLPFCAWVLCVQRRRRELLLAFSASAVVSVAVFGPWLAVVADQRPEAWAVWRAEFLHFAAPRGEFHDPQTYYLRFVYWMWPWTPLFMAGLVVPLLPSAAAPPAPRQDTEIRRLFAVMTLGGLVLLTMAHERQSRYALPLIPAAALMIAAMWQELARSKAAGPGATISLRAQWLTQFGAALGIVVVASLAYLTPSSWGPSASPEARTGASIVSTVYAGLAPATRTLGWGPLLAAASGVMVLSVLAERAQRQRRLSRAFCLGAATAWIFVLTIQAAYGANAVYHTNPVRVHAERVVREAAGRPIYTIVGSRPCLATLFYANRVLPARTPEELIVLARSGSDPLFVLAAAGTTPPSHEAAIVLIASHAARTATGIAHVDEETCHEGLYRLDPGAP